MVYSKLRTVVLRPFDGGDGETVTLARFNIPPDGDSVEDIFKVIDVQAEVLWATRLYEYLRLWGDPWVVQLKAMLFLPDVGFHERFFYFCHLGRDDEKRVMQEDPIKFELPKLENKCTIVSQVTVLVSNGVGIVGNVWTSPSYRRQGAIKAIMAAIKADFKARQWKVLFLGTGYDTLAYNMYLKYGFHPVEPTSGYMEYYGEDGTHDIHWNHTRRDTFELEFFRPADGVSDVTIENLSWKHYPLAVPLFLSGSSKCVVRASPLNLMGRISPELPFIHLIDDELGRLDREDLHRVQVLRQKTTNAVVGVAMWAWEPNYENSILLDVYCHDAYWIWGKALLAGLPMPRAKAAKFVVLADMECPEKIRLFETQGFQKRVMEYQLPVDKQKTKFTHMVYLEKHNTSFVPAPPTVAAVAPPLAPTDMPTFESLGNAASQDSTLHADVTLLVGEGVHLAAEDTLPDTHDLGERVRDFSLLNTTTERVQGDTLCEQEDTGSKTFDEWTADTMDEVLEKYLEFFCDDDASKEEMRAIEKTYMDQVMEVEEQYTREVNTAYKNFEDTVEAKWVELREAFRQQTSGFDNKVHEMFKNIGPAFTGVQAKLEEMIRTGEGLEEADRQYAAMHPMSSSSSDSEEDGDVVLPTVGDVLHEGDAPPGEMKRLQKAMSGLQKMLKTLDSDSESEDDAEKEFTSAINKVLKEKLLSDTSDKKGQEEFKRKMQAMQEAHVKNMKELDAKYKVKTVDSIAELQEELQASRKKFGVDKFTADMIDPNKLAPRESMDEMVKKAQHAVENIVSGFKQAVEHEEGTS
jgi:GNAT superfamily N-acetyltransferase